MSEGTQARVELEVVANLRAALDELEEFNSAATEVDASAKEVEKNVRAALDAIDGTGKAARGAVGAVDAYAEGFSTLADGLRDYIRLAREAAQVDVVNGSIDGKGLANSRNTTRDERNKWLAVNDAKSSNTVGNFRQINNEEDRVVARAMSATNTGQKDSHVQSYEANNQAIERASKQTATYNQYLYDQEKALAKVAAANRRATEVEEKATRAKKETVAAAQAAQVGTTVLTKAQYDLSRGVKESTTSMISARYALYDVATTAGIASAALLAVSAVTVAAAIKYETAFTEVERTSIATTDVLSLMRRQFLGLAQDIPLAFADISQIASLGAQLGVANGDLAGFAQTVAQFSAVTNVGIEQSAASFGALGELLDVSAADYERLGSSIAYVGVNSVATETEILSMATRLAASAANAGFAAEEVVALAGALSSLRVAPERAQGVMEVYFKVLNTAIANGGPRLEAFAQIAGTTSDQVARLVKEDPTAFFRSLAKGLGQIGDNDPVELTKALGDLGLSGIRAGEVFTRVSKNIGVFDTAIGDASSSYEDGSFLAEVYAMRLDDIASKFQLVVNGVTELAAAAGSSLLPVLSPVLDLVADLANGFAAMLETDAGQAFSGIALGATAIAGALLAIVSTSALAIASLFALRTAVTGLNWSAASGGARGFAASLVGVTGAAGAATTGVKVFRTALITTGIGAVVVLLGTLAAAFMQVGDNATLAFEQAVGNTAGMTEALAADDLAYKEAVASGNKAAADSFVILDRATQENKDTFDAHTQTLVNTATVLGTDIPNSFINSTREARRNTQAIGDNTIAWLRNQLMQSEGFQELAGDQKFVDQWETLGANFNDAAAAAAADGEAGVRRYFIGLAQEAIDSGAIAAEAISSSNSIIQSMLGDKKGGKAFIAGTSGGLNEFSKLLGGLGGVTQLLGFNAEKTGEQLNMMEYEGVEDLDKALKGAGNSARELQKEVYTLVDYAGDLSGVFSRAFEIRFSGDQGLDTITSGWSAIRKAVDDTNEQIRDYQATMQTLTADKAVRQYWLSVAENYGDALRAGELRAEIAQIDRDLSKTSKELSTAQDKNTKTLTGNTDGAIDNRAEILGLVGNYQSYIASLAASGMSQEDLTRKAAELKNEFMRQAAQLGYSRAEVDKYAVAFDDVRVAIANIPRNITVTANANPALQALNEFIAQARSKAANAGVNIPVTSSWDPRNTNKAARAANLTGQIAFLLNQINTAAGPSAPRIIDSSRVEMAAISARLNSGNYWSGGYTGDGGKYEPRGVVHGGEFVFSKEATKNIGAKNLAFQHNMAKSGKAVAPASSSSGSGIVQLSPADRQLLVDIRDRVGVSIAPQALQGAVNAGNVNSSNRRTN